MLFELMDTVNCNNQFFVYKKVILTRERARVFYLNLFNKVCLELSYLKRTVIQVLAVRTELFPLD